MRLDDMVVKGVPSVPDVFLQGRGRSDWSLSGFDDRLPAIRANTTAPSTGAPSRIGGVASKSRVRRQMPISSRTFGVGVDRRDS